jgi:integrase
VTFQRIQRKPRPTIPAGRIQEFLDTVDRATACPQKRCMVRIMLGLGLREGEVLGMRWEWFNPEQRTYTVGRAKGKEARVLPVPSWVWSQIMALPKTTSPWCFPDACLRPRRPNFLRGLLSRVRKEFGIGHITQHRLRASFASLHAEAGTPITEIQGMLGHKNITTTMIYVEQTLEAKRRAQDSLSKQLGLAVDGCRVV